MYVIPNWEDNNQLPTLMIDAQECSKIDQCLCFKFGI